MDNKHGYMVDLRASARTARELKYCSSMGVLSKTIVPFALVGDGIAKVNLALCA